MIDSGNKELLIEIRDLNFTYTRHTGEKSNADTLSKESFVLKNVSLNIYEGDFVSVIGKNGSGKSTLVKIVSGIISGYSGLIRINGDDINSIVRKDLSKKLSYLPQSTVTFNENMIVKDFLLLGRYAHKKFSDFRYDPQDNKVVNNSIEITDIKDLAGKHFHELSGGERQKALLTLSLVQLNISESLKGKILIIDEPLTYLDVTYQFEIFNIIKKLREKGLTVIIVIHDLNLALRFTGKTILMNNGSVIKYDESKNVITEDILREYFKIESEILQFEKNYLVNYLHN
ncbi:MAG TPA: ABC transporter ATP-binding protein [Ignavibacteria bacterium]|nr:ABC transporter ATP-binding protein [Ignavibacteria bacterium]